jgi:hypothetical protein
MLRGEVNENSPMNGATTRVIQSSANGGMSKFGDSFGDLRNYCGTTAASAGWSPRRHWVKLRKCR